MIRKETNVLLKICSITGQILFDSEPLEVEPVEETNPDSPYSALKLPMGDDAQGDAGAQHPSGCSPQTRLALRAPPGELGDAF